MCNTSNIYNNNNNIKKIEALMPNLKIKKKKENKKFSHHTTKILYITTSSLPRKTRGRIQFANFQFKGIILFYQTKL